MNPIFDSHVHLFPPGVFAALWRWFDTHAWKIKYRLQAEEAIDFLKARGVAKMTALVYSHKPEMARMLNQFVAELARANPEVVPLGTVLPGEPDARAILDEALGRLQLRGIKLHCHVQKIAPDDPRLDDVWRAATEARVPVVIHAGREPSNPAYGIDTRELCAASRIERVLQRFPSLKLIVPHLGYDEVSEYEKLLSRYENLWLDTTMVIGDFFNLKLPETLFPGRADRLLFGTDFPNIPYDWESELNKIRETALTDENRHAILWKNAKDLFD